MIFDKVHAPLRSNLGSATDPLFYFQMSISRKSTPRVYLSYTTVAHRLNKVGYKSLWNSIPLLYNGICQLLPVYGWVWSDINPSLLFIPNMFNGNMSGDIETQINRLMMSSAINCCVTLAVCGLAPFCCRIPFPSGKMSYMKGTTICANISSTYILAFTLRLKTTRRVQLCRVIPPHTCMAPPVTFPFP